MTRQQQEDVFGVSAIAENGQVLVTIGEQTAEMDPHTARRFMFYLARAHHDALYRERRQRDTRPTPDMIASLP